jgi:tRNA(Ile)-lysidine synthase
LSPSTTDRFTASLAPLWPAPPPARLGLAVSGGPDSLALLVLAHAALPGRVAAATVDHRLRREAAAEAAMVAETCAALGVPHATLPVTLAPGNLQAEGRTARYAALATWLESENLSALATAHHADDQAETLLARLNRGSGAAGLAGIRARSVIPGTQHPLIRPLLDWRRAELGGIVRQAGLMPAQDPSNTDPRFDRARIRAQLAQADWLDIPALAQSATHLADADAALTWAATREWAEAVIREPLGVTYRPQAPRAIALRVLTRIVTELDGEPPRGSAVARLFDTLLARQPASIGNLVARPLPSGWSFSKASRRKA